MGGGVREEVVVVCVCGGVPVPDPCLSGAAVFTVRKEAVSCVCPPITKVQFVRTENRTPPPPPPLGD